MGFLTALGTSGGAGATGAAGAGLTGATGTTADAAGAAEATGTGLAQAFAYLEKAKKAGLIGGNGGGGRLNTEVNLTPMQFWPPAGSSSNANQLIQAMLNRRY
jgi:hypothetical protein